MAYAQKPDLVFQRNGRVHLNRRGGQSSRLLAAEVCASAAVMVVMVDAPCPEVQCKTTGYPLHSHVSPSLPLPCVTTFRLSFTRGFTCGWVVAFGHRVRRVELGGDARFLGRLCIAEVVILYSSSVAVRPCCRVRIRGDILTCNVTPLLLLFRKFVNC